jgi:crotonobetaine/carnitine-CoA ligase
MAELPLELRGLNVRDFLEAAARAHPERPFLITREEQLSYGEVDRRVDAAAAAWQQLGVAKGDRVAFMLENSSELVLAWLGLAKLGAIMVGLNSRWKAGEVAYALTKVRPRHVLAAGAHLATVRAAGAERPLEPAEVLSGTAVEHARPELCAADDISFIFTSGTTGYPKAVRQTHGNYVLTGQATPGWYGLGDGDRFYCCLPLTHVNAQTYQTMGAIGCGGALILVERFSASRFWDDVHAFRANAFNFIGALLAILANADPGPHEQGHALKTLYGAPSMPHPELQQIEERFGGVRIISGFGMSETTFGLIEDSEGERRSLSMGKPRQHPSGLFANEARVVDEHGREAPPGEVGELTLRSPALMRGYFDDAEQTAEVLRAGWLHTGDYARRDADGFFYYVDRKKDLVRRRGENVSSLEVETVLALHPAVEEAAVIGVPSELTDEDVLALVQLAPGRDVDPAELAAWCAERLADFKVPRYIQLVDDLPRTSTGKVQKAQLRAAGAEPSVWWDREAAGRHE